MKKFGSALLAVMLLLAVGTTPAATQNSTRVHLIQGIPDTTVDVEIDGEVVISDLDFRGTFDLSSGGSRELPSVRVLRAGTSEVLLDAGTARLPDAPNVTVVLHLKPNGSPGLSSFVNDVSQLRPGQSRLIVRHLAAAPPVDVISAGATVFENLSNGQEVSADLPEGTVEASLVPTGTNGPSILGPADLTLVEGVALIVYGLGSFESGTMAVATESIDGLAGTPTAVNTGNSPIAPSPTVPVDWPLLALGSTVVALALMVRASWRADRGLL